MELLASRIRPHTLDEFVGQPHLVGFGKHLRMAIEKGYEKYTQDSYLLTCWKS